MVIGLVPGKGALSSLTSISKQYFVVFKMISGAWQKVKRNPAIPLRFSA